MLSNRETKQLIVGTDQRNLVQMYKAFVMRLSARIPFVQPFVETKDLAESRVGTLGITSKRKRKRKKEKEKRENLCIKQVTPMVWVSYIISLW
ncbi:MAG: hypothetical protein OCD01_14520 [Fibrobacterales bacterium]